MVDYDDWTTNTVDNNVTAPEGNGGKWMWLSSRLASGEHEPRVMMEEIRDQGKRRCPALSHKG